MSCTVVGDSSQEIYNKLNQGVLKFDLPNTVTRLDSLGSFAFLEEQLANNVITRREFDVNGESIRKYVWDLGNGYEFIFNKSPSMLSREAWQKKKGTSVKTDAFGEFTLIAGTTTHYAFEQLMLKRAGINPNVTRKSLYDEIKANPEMINLSQSVITKIETRVNEIYKLAEDHQNKIDQNQPVVVKVETPLVNAKRNMMGTQDLMFVFSDNTYWDFDYKSTVLTNDQLDDAGMPKHHLESITKRQSHELQMVAYKEAKIQSHGVNENAITRSEIIPIGLKISGMETRKGLGNKKLSDLEITDIFSKDEINGKLGRVATIASGSSIASLTQEIQDIKLLIENIKSKSTKTKGDVEKLARYAEAIRQFDKMSQDLLVHNHVQSIYETLRNVLRNIPSTINQPLTIDVMGDIMENSKAISNEEILIIKRQLEQLKAMQPVLRDMIADMHGLNKSNFSSKHAKDVAVALKAFEDQMRAEGVITENLDPFIVLNERIEELSGILLGRTMDTIGRRKLIDGKVVSKTLNFWESWLTVNTDIDHPGIRALAKLSNEGRILANQKYVARSRAFLKIAEEAANHANDNGISQVAMMDMMVDKNTGQMISKYTSEFFTEREEAVKNKDTAWMQTNHDIIDEIDFLSELATRRQAKLNTLRRVSGWTSQTGYPTALIQSDVERQMEDWEASNNLIQHPSAWLNMKIIAEFTKVNTSVDFLSNEYKELTKYPPIEKLYNEFTILWEEMRTLLGKNSNQIPDTFIPNIQKDIAESLSNFDFRNVGSDLKDQILDSVMVNEVDRMSMRSAKDGEIFEVPVLYMQPLHKDSGFANRLKSYDIISSALSFMNMAYIRQEMVAVMPDAEMILNFLGNPETTMELQTSSSGRVKRNEFGNQAKQFLKVNDASVYEKAYSIFNYNWLGIRYPKADNWPSSEGVFNPETGEVINQFSSAKLALVARNSVVAASLGFNIVSAAGANLGSFARAMIVGREKLAYTREQFIESTRAQKDPDDRDKQILATAYFNTSAEGIQQKDLWDSKGLIKGDVVKSGVRKWLSTDGLFKFFSGGDAILANIVTGAMLRNWGYDTIVGRVRRLELCPDGTKSLWESLQIDDKTGALTFDTIPGGLMALSDQESFYSAVRITMRSITGQLNSQELMGMQETILGTLFTTYRTWMPSILQSEFGKTQYLEQFEALREGRFNSLYQNYFKDLDSNSKDKDIRASLLTIVKGAAKLSKDVIATTVLFKNIEEEGGTFLNNELAKMQFAIWESENPDKAMQLGDTYEQKLNMWMDMKRRNLISAIAYLRTVGTLMATSSMMLAADFDDDDESDILEFQVSRTLFRIFNRAVNELATPISPSEILGIANPKIPAVSILYNSFKSIVNLVDETFGDEDKRDHTPFGYYGSKNVPVVNQVYKILYQSFYTNPPRTLDTDAPWKRMLGL